MTECGTATVTKNATTAGSATDKTTTTVTRVKKKPPTRTTTTVHTPGTPAQPEAVTVTKQAGERTFLERVLGDVGLVILQVGVLLLAAFLGAALVQRVIMGQYGGFAVGSFKLEELASASTSGLEAIGNDLKKLRDDAATAKDLKTLDRARRTDVASLKDDLALAYKRMDFIEKKLAKK